MFDIRSPGHESGRQLQRALSITVQDDTIQRAQRWIESSLADLGILPEVRRRLVTAMTKQIRNVLESTENRNARMLTIRLFSAGGSIPSSQGWGFFIIHKPSGATRSVLDIYIYREPPI